MTFTYSKLRGRIIERYGTQANFAETLNVSQATISRKLKPDTPFYHEEIIKWSAALGIELNDIGQYFFE